MPKKKSVSPRKKAGTPARKSKNSGSSQNPADQLQRPSAEELYEQELSELAKESADQAKPGGWKLSPVNVLRFIAGDEERGIRPKFVGRRAFLERAIVSLATNRGLMLIGEPGTAKSLLSELLAAAISGDSTLTIQGSAGTTEDNIKYSWNYAMLVADGPSKKSLVPAPLYLGMKHGKIVRFEEITRCPLEVQDVLLSVLSDRVLSIPELQENERSLFATQGFNVIATANTRDRGVNEMSAALKRRFNFETVYPIADIELEMDLVHRETNRQLTQSGVPLVVTPEITELLVVTFRELRSGKTQEGKGIDTLTTVLSTAEAVSTASAAGIHAYYYGQGDVQPEHVVQHIVGTVLKDNVDDLKKVRHYFEHVVKKRKSSLWRQFYEARHEFG